ncbi:MULTISPECIES: carbohydrate ABC transporter permease [unclassified Oceanispirochaeta]|uniref:carbohydrate ABC transporter permease n=1 Tax=unclassified Oceanispirochaeta TaxID=2635722 RepID=UPI000E093DD9|nr:MULTISPECIES: carbohydrate ABC transporter permease [unclassified Oceanispirochaeta]MBF9014274.1 carbohydrate ABC transporter permease [Oceanispirochaeta sp. M2]NPD71160.1 carbohydrate ABC transporter permease [Oceanispirochaeta sp. M1]RDG33552.1 carbohydrate ABC transporter permease [Oceanispirochaeta sp. M1]
MSDILLSRGEKAFGIFNTLLMFLLILIFLVPFLSVVMSSFVSTQEYLTRTGMILIPDNFDFSSYKMILKNKMVYNAYGITFFRTIVGTFLQISVTTAMAYGLSKDDLPGRKFIQILLVMCLVFPVQIIPQFLLIKNLGMINSLWSLIFPWMMNIQYIFLMVAFFKQIPASLEEAAIIDGCSHVSIFFRIILPLCLPSVATISLFYAVWHWNSWFDAQMFINDLKLYPMQNLLKRILEVPQLGDIGGSLDDEPLPSESIKGAVIVITSLPILCIYPFIQKYFVKGFMMGSVKG